MSSIAASSALENRLLRALPPEIYHRLAIHFELVTLTTQQILHPIGEAISHVYFPIRSLISLTTLLSNGSVLEVGLVGHDGFIGTSVILGRRESVQQAIVQVGDSALRLPIQPLLDEFEQSPALQAILLEYVQVLLLQTSQLAACHRFHSIRERLARQLLLIQTALQIDEFTITHEALAQMLGTRRSGITVAIGELAQLGAVRSSRGRITIAQRQTLEAIACECYAVIQAERDRFHR
ncbi:Crp/Fnr family transcriptional regulator [Leptolyngbya sp. NIES-2104]|uniref:Crp/Fnr family transcriptional regulator n=1 Tax=Leptolyngbya sp. NIES-2104 TaxID=1552121 RepID=UPI0006ECB42D|nr:Crp/Fnr family transcriptional regulator [Leptolyngbya sp. NIES-2104]GAP96330.1 cAMP-binding protein - catabolite gene activator and regulatory subunit of cAMP-dependent protein kinase [Leptolyngbya sp. NIES-2104]